MPRLRGRKIGHCHFWSTVNWPTPITTSSSVVINRCNTSWGSSGHWFTAVLPSVRTVMNRPSRYNIWKECWVCLATPKSPGGQPREHVHGMPHQAHSLRRESRRGVSPSPMSDRLVRRLPASFMTGAWPLTSARTTPKGRPWSDRRTNSRWRSNVEWCTRSFAPTAQPPM